MKWVMNIEFVYIDVLCCFRVIICKVFMNCFVMNQWLRYVSCQCSSILSYIFLYVHFEDIGHGQL